VSTKLPEQVKQWIDDKTVVSVATLLPNGQPQVSPVWATYDGDDILMSTLESRQKFRNLSKDPRVSVLVFPMSDPYIYAELRGEITMTREGGRELIDRLALAYTGEPYPVEPPDEVRVVLRLKIDKVAGRVSEA
jgi:PPOX class probable F420-dependent enzyme